MSNQFTPGPWRVVERERATRSSYSSPMPEIRAGDATIADVRWNGHNTVHGDANARLIAAAPALYSVLKDIVDYVSPGDDVPFAAMIDDACRCSCSCRFSNNDGVTW